MSRLFRQKTYSPLSSYWRYGCLTMIYIPVDCRSHYTMVVQNYIDKLVPIFESCEDLESLDDLYKLYKIMKSISKSKAI